MKNKAVIGIFATLTTCLLVVVGILAFNTFENRNPQMLEIKENVYVYDSGNVLSETTEEQLNHSLVTLTEKTPYSIIVATTEGLRKQGFKNYEQKIYSSLDVSQQDAANIVLFIYDKSSGSYDVVVGEKLNDEIDDKTIKNIASKYIENNQYACQYEKQVWNTAVLLTKEVYKINTIREIDFPEFQKADGKESNLLPFAIITLVLSCGAVVSIVLLVKEYKAYKRDKEENE